MNQVQLSGDPFADVGAAVLQQLLEQHPGWREREALAFATDVYVQSWQGKLHAFFLNSGITNPSNKGKEVEKTLEYYEGLLAAETEANGICRVSGRREPLFPAGRENQILAGSGTFLNFNHGLESGLQLGRSTLLSIYFAPLGCIEVGGSPALVHSSRPEITALLAAANLRENLRPAAALKPGLAKSSRGNPANALFGYVDSILDEAKRAVSLLPDGPVPALTLYNFTNFGAKPDVVLYHLSATVFDFYQQVMSRYPEAWTWFVRAHYRNGKFKGARARPDSTALLVPGKPTEAPAVVEPSTYQAWYNEVYGYLLAGKSLLSKMEQWARQRYNHLPFHLVDYYCQKLLDMDYKTLKIIADVARYVAATPEESKIKRTLKDLHSARAGSEVRRVLIGLQQRNYESDAPEPLLRLDDYVRYLFPDGSSWRQVRDLLLIALYEQLHESNRRVELEEGMEEVAAGDDDNDNDADTDES